jgi:hypothetical protein
MSLVAWFFLLILSKPLLNRFHEFSDLRCLAGNIPLRCPLAHGKDVFKYVLSHSLLATQDIGNKASCLSGVKGNPHKQPRKRLSLERIRLSIAVSMIGVRSSLYCMFTLFWRACLRGDDPVLETVNPSCSAIRWSSRLTMGSTHKVRCTVCRLGVGLFFDRAAAVFNECGRMGFLGGAGWRVPMRADEILPLSCTTEASTASAAAPFDCSEKTYLSD